MTWLVRSAVLAVLTAALPFSVPAVAFSAPAVHLDRARMFDRNSESIVSFKISTSHAGSMISAAVFGLPSREVAALPRPTSPAGGVANVNFVLPSSAVTPTAQVSAQIFATSAPLYADDTPLIAPPSVVPAPAPAGMTLSIAQPPPVRFGAYAPYVPSLQAVTADLRVPMRLGGLRFSGEMVSGMQTLHPDAFHALQVCGTTDQAAPCPYLTDSRSQSLTAATNFNIRAGNSALALQLSGGVEHFSLAVNPAYPFVPAAPDAAGATPGINVFDPEAPMLYYPGLTSVVKQSVGAKVALPVTPRVTVGLQYQRQHFAGDYGSLLFPGLDANKDTYLGNVTYQLPNSSSAITFSARQYRYQDVSSPNFNLTQTRADFNFTVKF